MSTTSLLVLYNAAGSLMGHLSYAYHHLRCDEDESCSACALTNGPKLSLSETKPWKELKSNLKAGKFIDGRKVDVKQLHKEEMVGTIKKHLEAEGLKLPCMLLEKDGHLETVFTRPDLDQFAGDQTKFEGELRRKLEPLL